MRKLNLLVALLLVLSLSGCSVVLLANRDTKRGDVNVMQIGAARFSVIAELGEKDNFTTIEGGGYDDRYRLDPDAHGRTAKVFTGLFYVAGDVFTLCLTELIFIPTEIAFKDKMVTYHLMYGPDQKLSQIEKIKS